ncbi:sigma-w pathway protein ysdB [Bacillaceae bacterium SIJ1]|uniref:sigma-w pathway protein ysdB n=1 Tax=Litoribacterium kuwaitense TaxID=1398745 RepID=UPI0013EA8F55|nr:sigma-w pathway protein ysdB [Litoribacterium kuwaitense]NGP45004.1 sigma-w pathway protein ysdB [Litoribacterium kuwaitense]
MQWLFILVLIVAVAFVAYSLVKYMNQPQRKLHRAKETHDFYLHDEPQVDTLKITYKGLAFEGKKTLGATEEGFEVISIILRPVNPKRLSGMTKDDFYFIEREVFIYYPNADVLWDDPVKQLFQPSS